MFQSEQVASACIRTSEASHMFSIEKWKLVSQPFWQSMLVNDTCHKTMVWRAMNRCLVLCWEARKWKRICHNERILKALQIGRGNHNQINRTDKVPASLMSGTLNLGRPDVSTVVWWHLQCQHLALEILRLPPTSPLHMCLMTAHGTRWFLHSINDTICNLTNDDFESQDLHFEDAAVGETNYCSLSLLSL